MTNIELETLNLAKVAIRKYIAEEIDWEQRRYEIAKDVIANMAGAIWPEFAIKQNDNGYELVEPYGDAISKCAVTVADTLIKELKERKK